MNNSRPILLIVAANILIAMCYGAVILSANVMLTSVMSLSVIGSLHVAFCCIAGAIFFSRGRAELAKGCFISAALLLATPFVLMLL